MTDQPALTPEREQEIRRWADHPTNAVLLAEIDRLRADLATAREAADAIANTAERLLAERDAARADLATARKALENAKSGFSEAYDYGCKWPIGLDDEPQEQRGMDRDTFIRNMELLERETRGALDRIGEQ